MRLNASSCSEMPCGGNRSQPCGGPYKIAVFQARCAASAVSPVLLRVRRVGDDWLDAVDVSRRVVSAAYNMLRILVTDVGPNEQRVQVWLNPTFADITGASVPPGDQRVPPHPPTPLLNASFTTASDSDAPGRAGLGATVSTGQWRIDYASVLPPVLF